MSRPDYAVSRVPPYRESHLCFPYGEAEPLPEGLDLAQIHLYREVGRVQFQVLLLELDAQVHFSWRLLGREPKSAEELLAVYGALRAAGTALRSRGIATMMHGVNAVQGYMRLFEPEPAIRAAKDAIVHFARNHVVSPLRHWIQRPASTLG